jgi:hypothetical protein
MPGQPAPTVYTITADTDDFKRGMDEAQKELRELQEAAIKAKGGLDQMQIAQLRAREATKAYREAQKAAAVELKKATKAAREQAKAAEESAKQWREFGTNVAGAAVAAGVALLALTADIASARNQILDMSKRTAIAAETLEGLKLAAEVSGREFQDLNEILNPFIARMAQVRAGSKEAEDRFKNLGISMRNAEGEIVDNDEALKRLVKRLQGAKDSSEQSAIAMEALGEGGGKLVQVLGDVPLETFIEQTSRWSILGDDAAQSARDWQLAQANAKLTDLLKVQAGLNRFVVGFAFAGNVVREFAENSVANLTVLSEVLSGDLEPSLAAATSRFRELGGDTFGGMIDNAEAATFEFIQNNKAIREGAEEAQTAAPAIGQLAKQHNNAAGAAKEQAEAEKRLAAQFKQQIAAEDELRNIASNRAESQLSELEKLEQARDDELNQINTLAFQAGQTAEAEKIAAEARLAVQEEFFQSRFNLAVEDAEKRQAIADELAEAETEAARRDSASKTDNSSISRISSSTRISRSWKQRRA